MLLAPSPTFNSIFKRQLSLKSPYIMFLLHHAALAMTKHFISSSFLLHFHLKTTMPDNVYVLEKPLCLSFPVFFLSPSNFKHICPTVRRGIKFYPLLKPLCGYCRRFIVCSKALGRWAFTIDTHLNQGIVYSMTLKIRDTFVSSNIEIFKSAVQF